MPIYSSIFINQSVGRNAKNAGNDVRTIQARLNELSNAPRIPLVVDGACGSKTRKMIRDFQINVVGYRWPDARVDPNGKTLALLNDPASEGKWGNMSIPPEPKGGGGGLDPRETPKSDFDAIDAAIEHVRTKATLTLSQEKNLRILFEKLWKVKRGGYTMTKSGLTEEDMNDWLDRSKTLFHVVRISLVMASAQIAALGTAAIIASFLGVILMVAGFAVALKRALTAHYRVYGAIATAHYLVWWAHGGPKPLSAESVIDNYESFSGETADRARFAEAWRDSQTQAGVGLIKAITETGRMHGLTYAAAYDVTKTLMQMQSRTDLLKILLGQLADGFHDAGDVQVANSLRSQAKSYLVKYPM